MKLYHDNGWNLLFMGFYIQFIAVCPFVIMYAFNLHNVTATIFFTLFLKLTIIIYLAALIKSVYHLFKKVYIVESILTLFITAPICSLVGLNILRILRVKYGLSLL